MIVTKTPLRISFFGGGSDIPSFYLKKPGMVISTAIDRSIMIAMNKCETDHVRLSYSSLEQVTTAEKLKHDRVREALKHFGIISNIEITSFSDVPTRGTGLGSSSTFTVGLLKGLLELQGIVYNKADLAELACQLEMEKLGEPIGKQDQYAAAYGGFNIIEFDGSGVDVRPVNIGAERLADLESNLFCFATGINRNAGDILKSQVKSLDKKSTAFDNTSIMVDLAKLAQTYLIKGLHNDFGAMLNETWNLKKKLSPGISSSTIDKMYEIGISNGALGGKLLGAGGGGYMLFYVPEKNRFQFLDMMKDYKRLNFKFTDEGASSWKI